MAGYQVGNFQVKSLANIENEPVGGKAGWLHRLIEIGLRVPEGFVLFPYNDPDGPGIPEKLEIEMVLQAYRDLGGGIVAVRSSAEDEDSVHASAAGQYETFLRVEGKKTIAEAVTACYRSVHSERVRMYRNEMKGKTSTGVSQVEDSTTDPLGTMAVIVQRMIEPFKAGAKSRINYPGRKLRTLHVKLSTQRRSSVGLWIWSGQLITPALSTGCKQDQLRPCSMIRWIRR